MVSGGFLNRWLFVDLTDGKIVEEEIEEPLLRSFLGGYGLGAKILYDRMKPNVDPLGPENMLGFLTGPLTGTPAIIGSRFMVVGKSPLTGGWGDSNCGGNFGPHMKFAGVDGVFFKGVSDEPVYLLIRDGKAEIRSAAHLWGKNCLETETMLKNEVGKGTEVACIGLAGEKQSLISGIMTDFGRAAGRSGLGAVMGSKRLKAVVVQGQADVPMKDAELAAGLRKEYLKQGDPGLVDFFRAMGTPGVTEPNLQSGDLATKNWADTLRAGYDVAAVNADAVIARQERKYGCWRCPLSCGGHMKLSSKQTVSISHKPEYETIGAFGAMCLNDDLDSIILANDLCNDYGLDTISTGSTIAFAMECYEKGLLTKEDTGGIELTWGNGEAVSAMTELIGKREGIGDVLADGVKLAAERIGKGAEQYAVHVGGQEPGMHNPRVYPGLAFVYQVDATPGRHCPGAEHQPIKGYPLEEADRWDFSSRAMAENRKRLYCMQIATASLGLCLFGVMTYGVDLVPPFLKATTGWDVDLDEVLTAGERIANIRLLFTLREGFNPLAWAVPGRLIGRPPTEDGVLAGVVVDIEKVEAAWLERMGWDPVTCRPSAQKLAELGLAD
jgi:aldehyde:ferredoxin oxidoreductase